MAYNVHKLAKTGGIADILTTFKYTHLSKILMTFSEKYLCPKKLKVGFTFNFLNLLMLRIKEKFSKVGPGYWCYLFLFLGRFDSTSLGFLCVFFFNLLKNIFLYFI